MTPGKQCFKSYFCAGRSSAKIIFLIMGPGVFYSRAFLTTRFFGRNISGKFYSKGA
jgi:hypothetical protein